MLLSVKMQNTYWPTFNGRLPERTLTASITSQNIIIKSDSHPKKFCTWNSHLTNKTSKKYIIWMTAENKQVHLVHSFSEKAWCLGVWKLPKRNEYSIYFLLLSGENFENNKKLSEKLMHLIHLCSFSSSFNNNSPMYHEGKRKSSKEVAFLALWRSTPWLFW